MAYHHLFTNLLCYFGILKYDTILIARQQVQTQSLSSCFTFKRSTGCILLVGKQFNIVLLCYLSKGSKYFFHCGTYEWCLLLTGLQTLWIIRILLWSFAPRPWLRVRPCPDMMSCVWRAAFIWLGWGLSSYCHFSVH